jgi:hypothetical protein
MTFAVARDQYGNFLIQWILNNASPHLRDIVQAEIRYASSIIHKSLPNIQALTHNLQKALGFSSR